MNAIEENSVNLSDQNARDHFAQNISTNFSVIAPAGVGKTTAIVNRVFTIVKLPNQSTTKKLVVVTYTQKAADELLQRTRHELLRLDPAGSYLQVLKNTFFGTIHSFCHNFLKEYGLRLGLKSNFELVENDHPLWLQFIRKQNNLLCSFPKEFIDSLYKLTKISSILNLGRNARIFLKLTNEISQCPELSFQQIFNFIPNSRNQANVDEGKKFLASWLDDFQGEGKALGVPFFDLGGNEFKELWANTFFPLWKWLGQESLKLVTYVAKEYREFRISKGFLKYDDLIDIAVLLIRTPDIKRKVISENYSVILDEAQDTDRQQFEVLLGVVGGSVDNLTNLKGGSFAMVGDPQQAIYSSRADLPTYLKVHNALVQNSNAQVLTFTVTMRCDRQIVRHINDVFPNILKEINLNQVDFVPLESKPWAGEGAVLKLLLEEKASSKEENCEELALANWIFKNGKEQLGIQDWSDLAILTPRKSWLIPIAHALNKQGIKTQIHSRDDTNGDNPAYAWVCALMKIAVNPTDSLEVFGVLREIFGISDGEIATYVQKFYKQDPEKPLHPLNIFEKGNDTSKVGNTLSLLQKIALEAKQLSISSSLLHWIDKTLLRSRLSALPDNSSESLNKIVDDIAVDAIRAEEEGLTHWEWTSELIQNLNRRIEEVSTLKDHIQLYTCHKAKGLEWKVVVVPFVFRSIRFPSLDYPCIYDFGDDNTPVLVPTYHPAKKHLDERLDAMRVAELERLAYVSATRARNTLIWVDDEYLFPNSKNSFADFLRIKKSQANHHLWCDLSTSLQPTTVQIFNQPAPVSSISQNADFAWKEITAKAIESANLFLKRNIPSELAIHDLYKENLQSSPSQSGSTTYGNWWHDSMKSNPWNCPTASWRSHFNSSLQSCPFPERGAQEFDAFLNSPLSQKLSDQNLTIKTEVSFLTKLSISTCIEGFIDLVAFNSTAGYLFFVDWKTDRNNLQNLKTTYSGQIYAYKDALKSTFNFPIVGYIYSTHAGDVVKFE